MRITPAGVDIHMPPVIFAAAVEQKNQLIMQVTRAGEYAIIGLLYLARQPEGRTVMVDEISEHEGISKSFLAKIFQTLSKGGFVKSHRGAGGGFSLAQAPADVSLLQVLTCIEKAFALQRCVTRDPHCVVPHRQLNSCTLCGIFNEAQNLVNDLFNRTSLEDLLRPRASTLNFPVSKP